MGNVIYIKQNNRLIPVKVKDISFIEADKDHVKVNGHTIRSTVHNMISKLPSGEFVRIHSSYIVQLDKITVIDGDSVTVDNIVYPLARHRKDELMKLITIL